MTASTVTIERKIWHANQLPYIGCFSLLDRQAPARRPQWVLDFPKIIITAIVGLAPIIDCSTSARCGKESDDCWDGAYRSSRKTTPNIYSCFMYTKQSTHHMIGLMWYSRVSPLRLSSAVSCFVRNNEIIITLVTKLFSSPKNELKHRFLCHKNWIYHMKQNKIIFKFSCSVTNN
jgi:hypothetical protein